MDLSIIVVNWNSGKFLEKCLDSIHEENKDLDFEIRKDLSLIERNSNRLNMLIDQLLDGFYGITSVEAMMSEKPVICYWKYHEFANPPFMNTTPKNLKENLMKLIESASLRRKLGSGEENGLLNTTTQTTLPQNFWRYTVNESSFSLP